jgi:hypothetical protein
MIMLRSFVLVGVLVSGPAVAQEYESNPALVTFQGSEGVVNQRYEFPLVVDVGFIIDEIGVVASANAGSNLLLEMEGESRVAWPDEFGGGDVVHRIEPLSNGSRLAMTAGVDVGVDFIIGVFGQDFNFSLLSESLTFEPEVNGFTPFLLPNQTPNQMRIDADPTGGGLDLPFNFNLFDIGVLGVSIGVVFTATPETFSTVRGVSLTTDYDGDNYRHTDPTTPNSMWIYEHEGSMEMESTYQVDVTTQIGYRFVGSGGLTVEILGSSIPITIEFLNQYINLFAGVERPTYTSGSYTHDLPKVDTPIEEVDFGTIEVGDTQTFTFPVNNDGFLDLEALVGIEGDVEISVAPPQLFAEAGGQDAAILTFAPQEAGDYTATLILQTSDPLDPELRIAVVGKAVKPDTPDTPFEDDNNTGFEDGGGSSIYNACGCAGGGGAPGWGFGLLVPLLLLRRRD